MHQINREDNGLKGRFVIYENDEIAGEMTYIWNEKQQMIIQHTEVDEKFGGKGLGKKLVLASVDEARQNGFKIISHCSYAQKVLETDPNLSDVST